MDATDCIFWRDAALPYLELRTVADGRALCYGKHAHDVFSIGAIRSGTSTYFNGRCTETVGAGTVVIMNPGEVHACNPHLGEAWSYSMLYVDPAWLGQLQSMLAGEADTQYRPFAQALTAKLFAQLNRLSRLLMDRHASILQKQCASIDFFSALVQCLAMSRPLANPGTSRLSRAAEFIDAHFRQAVSIDTLSHVAGLSSAHFMREFKKTFGMSPHAYLINRRIQQARVQLKEGKALADVAIDLGFADQAHFQHTFKQLVAATPGHYREALAPANRSRLDTRARAPRQSG
ncbi:helix-turn-helix domain-containing protein [Massilia sp. CCM 8733]|uniref:Helix-turn-helix domain-containing protein n=1 Tax=Massilia mucilaginosa TaxID=2609282 RepID=A0ABX0NS34_9BURK|nr:AraC family transcriptional regulator [Massilia mucilaginosa]NHZ89605.1 helix-turn-helix domain-containing protein [Massilia mucilaginosa]